MHPPPKHTRRWFQFGLTALLVVVSCAAVLAAVVGHWLRQPTLIEIDSTTYGDPNYVITVKEAERRGNLSTVKVDRKKGFSIGSVMFTVRALCDIAKARDAEYFVKLDEWREADGTWMMIVGFTNTKNAKIQQEFGDHFSDYDTDGQEREYFHTASVAAFLRDDVAVSLPIKP